MDELNLDFDAAGFAARLREAIVPEKPTAFAARVGVPHGTVSKYLAAGGANGPRLDIVAKMAEGLGTSLDWLVWGRGEGPDSASGFVRVPRYDAQLAAGAGSWNEGRRRLDDIPFTQAFLLKRLGRSSAAGLAVLEARGDSMEPNIKDGALLLVDENDTRIIDGVFAFVLDGDARVKRFRKQIAGVTILSDNPAYPPETIEGADQDKLQMVGRVRWVGQMIV